MTYLVFAAAFTLIVSGFCSLLEAFILSVTDAEIEGLKKRKPRRGRSLATFKKDIEETTSAILTLNTIANTMGASTVGALASWVYGADKVMVLSWTGGMVVGILVLSEIFPKNLGVIYRRQMIGYLVFPLHWVRIAMWPLSRLAMHSVRLVIKSVAVEQMEDQEQEIKLLAEKHAKEGSLTMSERDMIHNALSLDDVTVSEIMTPRTVVQAIESGLTVDDIFNTLKVISFGRLPVYEDNIDNIVGLVRRRELLQARADDQHNTTVTELMGDAIFIPETATAAHALQQFLKKHQQLAVVVDEFGSTVGVVTMEDIMEHILGKEIYEDSDVAVDMRELARQEAEIKSKNGDTNGGVESSQAEAESEEARRQVS